MSGAPAGAPRARAWRERLRRGRRAHHHRSLGDALTDLYMLLWVLGVYGSAVVSDVRAHLRAPGSATAGAGAETRWLAAAALLTAVGLAWRSARAVGPLLATNAEQSWGLSTPVDRRAWLAPRFAAVILSAALAGGLAGLAGSVLEARLAGSGWAALAGALGGAALAACAVLAQGDARGSRWIRPLGDVLLALGAAAAAALVLAHHAAATLPAPAFPPPTVLAALGLPLAAAALIAAARSLRRLSRPTLGAGADVASAAVGATVFLDPSLLTGVLELRRWRRIGRVRSRRFTLGRLGYRWALLEAEIRRQLRRPAALAVWAALALAQYVVAMALPSAAVTARILLGYVAAGRLMGGLRSLSRSPGLRRSLGGGEVEQRLIHVIVPALGTILWWALTAPAGGVRLDPIELVMVAGVLAAAYRTATRPPMSYGGMVIETPLGLLPVELVRQLARGPDVLAIVFVVRALAR